MAFANQSADSLTTPQPGDYFVVRRESGPDLAGLVTEIVGYRERAGRGSRQTEVASLTIPLVISFGSPFAIGLGRTPGDDDRFNSFTSGLFAGPVVIESQGFAECVQVNFTPLGARRFFDMPMSELTDRMVALEDVLGAEGAALREKLANDPDWNSRLATALHFVTARLAMGPASGREVGWAYNRILAFHGHLTVTSLAKEIGWSRKHLAARFAADIGLGPKTISRIVRFNRVTALAQQQHAASWADVAADCGYSDQAHMAREFQQFSGQTPGTWRSGLSANG